MSSTLCSCIGQVEDKKWVVIEGDPACCSHGDPELFLLAQQLKNNDAPGMVDL